MKRATKGNRFVFDEIAEVTWVNTKGITIAPEWDDIDGVQIPSDCNPLEVMTSMVEAITLDSGKTASLKLEYLKTFREDRQRIYVLNDKMAKICYVDFIYVMTDE